jgi:hypothetical protein
MIHNSLDDDVPASSKTRQSDEYDHLQELVVHFADLTIPRI